MSHKRWKSDLKSKGYFVLDFLNAEYVKNVITPSASVEKENIIFNIKKHIEGDYILKEIDFEDKGEKFHFTEKVQALRLEDFEKMMEEAGIYLLDIFGDYKLRKFFKTQSERLIMIFK